MFQINKISYKSQILLVILFFIALTYIFLMTNGVPFFWDNHEFHDGYAQTSYMNLVKTIFQETGSSLVTGRPTYGLYFKGLFEIFGLDYSAFRLANSLLFALSIVLIAILCLKFIADKFSLFLIPLFIMFAFPLFVQVLTFCPWFITSFFILLIILLFLSDYNRYKTSFFSQIAIILLCLVSFRMYSPSIMIFGVLFLFIFLNNLRKFRRYTFLLLVIFLMGFPVISFIQASPSKSSLPHGINTWNLKRVFLNEVGDYILSPLPNPSDLYYKPFIAIITFFGFWLLVGIAIIAGLYILRKYLYFGCLFHGKKEFKHKILLKFCIIWLLCESSIWFFIPEHSIRSSSGSLIPLTIFFGIIILNIHKFLKPNYKKLFILFILLMVSFAVLTNIAYSGVFRASWGSSFTAYEKTTRYLEGMKNSNSLVLYQACSVASEYIPLRDYSGRTYQINQESYKNYRKECDAKKFSKEELITFGKVFSEVYVLKRITSFLNNPMPALDFETYENLELIQIIEGKENVLFDKILTIISKIAKINYQPNKILIYKLKK